MPATATKRNYPITDGGAESVLSPAGNCLSILGLLRGFEQALFGFFLAFDAVPRPGDGFQSLGVDFFAAGNAFSEAAFANARKRAFDHVEQLPVVVALAEEKLLGVGTGGAIGDILRGSSSAARPSCWLRVTMWRNSCCRVSSLFLNVSIFFFSMFAPG